VLFLFQSSLVLLALRQCQFQGIVLGFEVTDLILFTLDFISKIPYSILKALDALFLMPLSLRFGIHFLGLIIGIGCLKLISEFLAFLLVKYHFFEHQIYFILSKTNLALRIQRFLHGVIVLFRKIVIGPKMLIPF
jgi:hypothetical protein